MLNWKNGIKKHEGENLNISSPIMGIKRSLHAIRKRAGEVYHGILARSENINEGNFKAISPLDLETMFHLYDRIFLMGYFESYKDLDISFRLSSRMTSAGGKTSKIRSNGRVEYEICLSTPLLFGTFLDVTRPITVNGVKCKDRLEAALRIMEHEIIHLLEMLEFGDSSCKRSRFKALVKNIFGHTDVTHRLVTPRERAHKKMGLKAGDRVKFLFDGVWLHGVIYRITRRATVMVKNDRGDYCDAKGNRYEKFYVPLGALKKK